MLATCVVNGWDTTTYRSPDHPLQVALGETVADLAGEKVAAIGVDGCGAPIFGLSLTGLARAFHAWALGTDGSPQRRTYDAVRANPLWIAGTGREVSELIAGVPGLVAKDGAEAVYAAALADGRAVALKIEDGGHRAGPPLLAAALTALGVDAPVVAAQSRTDVLGGGVPVGHVRAIQGLFPDPLR
jgi:L-asparaginase II